MNTAGLIPSRDKKGTRGKITEFTNKSRKRFLKFIMKIEQPFVLWLDWTFADDVLQGLTLDQKAAVASRVLRNIKRWFDREYPGVWFVWKREWQERKSGNAIGELMPHFHVLIGGSISLNDVMRIQVKWVNLTGTKDHRAIDVACHPDSWRQIRSRAHAQRYVTKYTGKAAGSSRGRSWGAHGPVPVSDGVTRTITYNESIKLLRFLRRFTKRSQSRKAKYKLTDRLKKDYVGFVLISEDTVNRYMGWDTDFIPEDSIPCKPWERII